MKKMISIRTIVYTKEAVATQEDDDAHLLKSAHKEFVNLVNKGIFELLPCRRVSDGETLLPIVRSIKQK